MDDAKKVLKKKRSTSKGKFHRIYGRLLEGVQGETDPIVIVKILQDLETAYHELEAKHEAYLENFDSDNEADKPMINDLNHDMNVMYKELIKSRSLVEAVQKRNKAKDMDQTTDDRKPKSSEFESFRVKKLDAPTFSGNVRDYPSFKVDFERHMVSVYGQDPFALKQCLGGEALSVVKGVDNDYSEMVHRLDMKYGRAERLVDSILNDLKKLKRVQEGENLKFISMVDTIEKCWLDLKRMKLEREMNTATIVSQIEKLLPPIQKREWALRKDRSESDIAQKGFQVFLDFLLEEKNALEYIEADSRESGSYSKGKVNTAITENDDERNNNLQQSNTMNVFHTQIKENNEMMKQVIDGLAQVAQAVSNSQSKAGRQNAPDNLGTVKYKCWYHKTDNHDILECNVFQRLDVQGKLESLRQNNGCFSCLKIGHQSRQCRNKVPCDMLDQYGHQCMRFHHKWLHAEKREGQLFHNSTQIVNENPSKDQVLLMVSSVRCKDQAVTTLWDPGANMSLITHKAAQRLGLHGKDVILSITKVGNVHENIQSKEYLVPLTDLMGKTWNIKVYGMEEVTAEIAPVDTKEIMKLFAPKINLCRPTGEVDMLIGTDCCVLMPNLINQIGNLQLMRNQFGYCLRGSHPLLQARNDVSHETNRIYWATGKIFNVNAAKIIFQDSINRKLDSIFDVEGLSQCSLKCGSCKCGNCVVGQSQHSLREERELALIESGMKHDDTNKQWVVQYPWIKDPKGLPNNVSSAVARMKSTEHRLIRNGQDYAKAYDDQIQDMCKRGVARKLTSDELMNYKGSVHYIPHQEVLKPESKSTPVRIVFNSSASYMGHTLNDYWAKGSNVLNDLLAILIRFRQEQVALTGDISKMYNAVSLSPNDQHTHRFVWRNLETHRGPDHYALTTVTFGDKPSGAIATLALRKTAEMKRKKYPEAAEMIIRNSYVDDLLQSVECMEKARQIAYDAERILAYGGFKIKHWIVSGKNANDDNCRSSLRFMESEEEKVLGLKWTPITDHFSFKVEINFEPKNGKVPSNVNFKENTVNKNIPEVLTPRMVLSQLAKTYDPLGLVLPVTLAGKILLRKLCTENNKDSIPRKENFWDSEISEQNMNELVKFLKDLSDIERLEFRRCVKPPNTTGNPMLVVFSDGSDIAYGTCAYVRWRMKDGTFQSRLVLAKNRIAPTRKLTIPRLELCGAILSVRIREKVVECMDYTFDRIIHIVDSMIVRAQIQKETYGFGTFVATRVAEIQNKSDPMEWWWVSTELNVADMTTRVHHPSELNSNSRWQNGPEFLKLHIDQWPIRQDCDIESCKIPDVVGVTMSIQRETDDKCYSKFDDVNVENVSSYKKLLKVTSILMNVARNKSFKGAATNVTANEMRKAEIEWIRYEQRSMPDDWQRQYKRFCPEKNKDGIVVVGKRIDEWLRCNWNKTELPLLPNKSRFVWLFLKSVHDDDHAGVDTTVSKSRSKNWIPGIIRIVKQIKKMCVLCRRYTGKCTGQHMGSLPLERLKPSPAFAYTSLDLFGPFTIKDTVKGRTHGKGYGVIFNCMASRAVYLDVADGYDTNSFLMVLRRFVSIHGYPKRIRSDPGSQLVAASKELKDVVIHWNWNAIKQFGLENGLEWLISKSADAPWENGCSEALIKSAKKSLLFAIGQTVMTFSELQTVLFEVANLMNERPIGVKSSDPNDGTYLCPNDLLLGRASSSVPIGIWDKSENFKKRWKFVQEVVNSFWRKWHRDYFPSLIVRQKWHCKLRNIRIGDIVLIQDNNTFRGNWQLGQVSEIVPGRDGSIRDVTVRYKLPSEGSTYKGIRDSFVKRSVHRLIVLLPTEEQDKY